MISHSKHGILLKVLYAKGGTLTVTCAVQCGSDDSMVCNSSAQLDEYRTCLVAMAVKHQFNTKLASLNWKWDRN